MRLCLARIHFSGTNTYTCEKTIGEHTHFRSKAGTWLVLHTAPSPGGAATISWETEATEEEQEAWPGGAIRDPAWGAALAEEVAKRAQSTEGADAPSSDLEILGHNSTDGGPCAQNVSSAEHLRTAPPNTGNPTPTSSGGAEAYAPQRHARIVWDDISAIVARRLSRDLLNPLAVHEGVTRSELHALAKEAIATVLTRAHAIGFAHGRASPDLASALARGEAREGQLRVALRCAAGALSDVTALRGRVGNALDAAYAALETDAAGES